MKLKIIAVGKIKDKSLNHLIEDYKKQIKDLTIVEVNDEKLIENIKREEKTILSKIDEGDFVIALVIEGETFDSVEFANRIDKIVTHQSSSIIFVIGGSFGLTDNVKNRANLQMSFSKMTFPHQLMRLILVEQIYRALSILRNHPYHK